MKPKFFLTSASLPLAMRDDERREQLSEWLTNNEWFAIALVNRLWAELVGEPFYPAIDDIGPDREPTAPTAMKLLAKKFIESGYDVKWLLATICQHRGVPTRSPSAPRSDRKLAFVANVPQRLRSDQLFNVMYYTALGGRRSKALASSGYGGQARRQSRPREQFRRAVRLRSERPPRESIAATIPQSLALMNGSDQLNQAL